MTLKQKIKLKIIEFLYDHKLFGVHKRCWVDLYYYVLVDGNWDSVKYASKCGYCGTCMTKEEIEKGGGVNE